MTMQTAENGAGVSAALLEKVVIGGDLSLLSPTERLGYYKRVCDSLGLNPLTRPFEYIKLSGRLTLYPKKDATEQLAKMHGVSIRLQEGRYIEGVYLVQATASTADRAVDATGAVAIEGLKGEAKANALMKAETKASRRAVLRLVGLGWLDESELDGVPHAAPVAVDHATGEILPEDKGRSTAPNPSQAKLPNPRPDASRPAAPPDGQFEHVGEFFTWAYQAYAMDTRTILDIASKAIPEAHIERALDINPYLEDRRLIEAVEAAGASNG